ncbi:microcin C ABC transporter permease YejB [Desulfohalobium retbaense]|uniref:Binding-protein-dependent transport systems inner membrane component n=1 Tax=Desulfohalobium retbaense (strain ATCC 49708 / DSM 5692 / JCM 16813 / HR100) TaxID=485915 RepID=C8WZK6_DESRD|nr:microcin C ABC transporter permease YejB [Desulfohalobium retbaense]ACV67481.1 binding-protein-dependent transport systems inner membrane component [Desulfohalobium retbaense DSM 5692]
MGSYILRRLFLMVPTLLGILTINFFLIQAAPGGPVEQFMAKLHGQAGRSVERFAGSESGDFQTQTPNGENDISYRGAQGLDPELVQKIEKLYGFDKPMWQRYIHMLGNYLRFDLGDSFFRERSVMGLILSKLPVSVSLGFWSTLIIYAVSIPLGIRKALHHGSRFDVWSSTAIIVGNAIPVFLFAILLIVLFAGGSYWDIFPLRGLTSPDFADLSLWAKIKDYFWHLTLPVLSMVIGGFATLTLLTKNSFLDEIGKQYVVTARAKGLTEKRILYGHVFRNAMLIIIAGFPAAFISMFFTGSLLIEVIFSLDGLGLLGFESTLQRDYPVMFGTLYIFTLIGLLAKLASDLTYTLVDPRIDFERRD